MATHAAHNARRVAPKPREPGAAHGHVHHEKRHKTTEGRSGFIGAGATINNVNWASGTGVGVSYPGVGLDDTGLKAYNSAGVITLQISAADGSLTVNGTGVITGGTIQTSATNPRVIMDGSGLRAYNASGSQTFQLSGSDGSLTVTGTGIITGATIQTSVTNPRVVIDPAGVRSYDVVGTQRINLGSDGSFNLNSPAASITAAASGVTISSVAPTLTSARVIMSPTGIVGYNASNQQEFLLDATSGLIQATGVITAQPGSTVPWQTTGFYVGGGNLLPNSSAEDPTTTTQLLYLNNSPVTINMVEVNADGTRNGSSGFETDMQGWSAGAIFTGIAVGGAIVRTTAQAFTGGYSLQVNTTALGAPPSATPGTATSGGTIPDAQTFQVARTYVGTGGGETTDSVTASVTTGTSAVTTPTLLSSVGFNPGNAGGTSPAINTTNATLLVVTAGVGGSPTVTDSLGNNWTVVDSGSGAWLAYAWSSPSGPLLTGASHTVTISGSGAFPSGWFSSYRGTWTGSDPMDAHSSAGSTGSLTARPGSITPSQNGELLVTVMRNDSSYGVGNQPTIDSGFGVVYWQDFASGVAYGNATATLVQATAAAINPTWTHISSGGNNNSTLMVAFKRGVNNTIVVPSPPAEAGAVSWYAYVSQAGGSTLTRQQPAGSPTAIGTAFVLAAPPTSSGAAPPASDTTSQYQGALFNYVSLTGGTTYTASAWVKGNIGGEVVALWFGTAASANVTLTNTGWQRLSVSYTPSSTGNASLGVRSSNPAAIEFFLDAVQVEAGSIATPYSASRFTLQYGSNTPTAYIYANSTPTQVQAALNAAGVLPAGVLASATAGNVNSIPTVITLAGFATPAPSVLTVASQSLTGASVVVGQAPPGGWTTAWPYGWPYQDATDVIAYPSAFHGGNVFRVTAAVTTTLYVGLPAPVSYGWTAGTTRYTLSAYFRAPTAVRTPGITVDWYEAGGNRIYRLDTTASFTTRGDQWQRFFTTAIVPPASTAQKVSVTGGPTGGSFTLVYGGQTATISSNYTAAQVQTALTALSSIGSSGVTVSGGPLPGTPVVVIFQNPPFTSAPASLALGTNSLTGGTSPGVVISNSPATSMMPYFTIINAAAGEVFYMDALQMETGDAPAAYAPKPDEVLANTITANMINVGQLSAISANIGTVTAGTLSSVTVTGAVVQTSATNPRVWMDTTGLYATNSLGTQTFALSGSTGNLTVFGGSITGAVIQTAATNPRTVLDSTGFWVSDNTGNHIVSINSSSGITIEGNGASTPNSVTFTDTTGASFGSLYGNPPFSGLVGINLQCEYPGTSAASSLNLQSTSGGSSSVVANAGSQNVTVIDNTGYSSFAHRGSTSPMFIECGSGTVTWSGGTSFSNTTSVAVSTPVQTFMAMFIQETSNSGNTGGYPIWEARYIGGSPVTWNIQAQVPGTTVSGGQSASFYWLMVSHG